MSMCKEINCMGQAISRGEYCFMHSQGELRPAAPSAHEEVLTAITKRLNAKREQILPLRELLKSLDEEYFHIEGEYLRATRNR